MNAKSIFFLIAIVVSSLTVTMAQTNTNDLQKSYSFQDVKDDPMDVQMYELDNGLKLFMSVNKEEPRIYTNIVVRAGSKHDPADATGLAHYLEHMMFKGTDEIGALDWQKESSMLGGISRLYEKYRSTDDPDQRKLIYNQIDRISNEAATLVAANEYDKMVASLGAQGTNAYTSVEQTVYVNDIPSNELERWMKLEGERFTEVVLRLFHTELEAVYEEFNIGQDSDIRKGNKALREILFPTHPYGTQTTIGTGEHLKNPSHVKIQEYFRTYYVPNNMAIVLAGDFDPQEAVALAEKYFGDYRRERVPEFTYDPQPRLEEPVEREVFGQSEEYVDIAWRFEGANTDDYYLIQLIQGILYNRQAGLLDIHLNQKQRVLSADAYNWIYEDFTALGMTGKPREGQSLEEVRDLLLEQVETLKQGEFQDWLLDAVIRNLKVSDTRRLTSNNSRAYAITNAFVLGMPWDNYVNRFEKMQSYTKKDVVAFAREHLKDNYALVYKRSGEDKGVYKVEKPAITPVSLNRTEQSEWAQEFFSMTSPEQSPVFVDFEETIQRTKLSSGVELHMVKNEVNNLFNLYYIFEMGKNSNKLLPLAIDYLPYLGTSKYTPEELKEEFFKLGLSFNVSSNNDQVYVTLSGLPESFRRGVLLLEELMRDVEGNQEALDNMVKDILAKRANAKKDKRRILRSGMANYARYGEVSPFTDVLSEEELKALTPEDLTRLLKGLLDYEHTIFYYGNFTLDWVKEFLEKEHEVPADLKPVIPSKEYSEVPTDEDRVYFVDFPMVQAEVLMMSKGTDHFDQEEYLNAELYNNYFGYGLSSIVFQEIRESRALAYSAYAYFGSPSKKEDAHYLQAYVGTQADKLRQAIPAMKGILNEMPVSEDQIENARASILKKIETERVTGTSVYWTHRSNQRRGIDGDLRKAMYEHVQQMSIEDLKNFQQAQVKDRNYTILVLGSRESLDIDYLQSLGVFKELTLEEVFGY